MARPRRSRWTVTLERRGVESKDVILALPSERHLIMEHYEAKGYTVKQIVHGDYRLVHQGGWRVSTLNLREATVLLGLKWPVRIKQISHKGSISGRHRVRYDANGRPYHFITAKAYLHPDRAGEVLHHELQHALQAEELAESIGAMPDTPEYNAAYKIAYRGLTPGRQRGTRYKTRPWEVEARRAEANNADLPLARR
jgi:hypothetical protein